MVAPKLTQHQHQGTSGKRAANSVSSGKKRFEPVRRGFSDTTKREKKFRHTFEKMEGFSFVKPITGLNRPNTGKEEDDITICDLTHSMYHQ
jgi:hypothetical protein